MNVAIIYNFEWGIFFATLHNKRDGFHPVSSSDEWEFIYVYIKLCFHTVKFALLWKVDLFLFLFISI